jgi:hypothetical protein
VRWWIGGAFLIGCFVACGSDDADTDIDDDGISSSSSSGATTSSSSGGGEQCPPGQFACDTYCAALESDAENCGVCGNQCPADQVCVNGACSADCDGGLTKCGSFCADVMSDQQHCGACNSPCASGQTCDGMGSCAAVCPPGQVDCGGQCINTDTDEDHCGGCDSPCTAGLVCDGMGMCGANCSAGLVNCDGSCIDPMTEELYCGARGNCMGADAGEACGSAQICNGGMCETVTCNDQFEPTANSNDSESTGKVLAVDPVSDCSDPATESGAVSGVESDWYRYQGDDALCYVIPTVSLTQASADVQLCMFLKCTDDAAMTQFSCPLTTTNATSPDGRYGCCGTGTDVSIAVDDVNCTGTFNEDLDVFIRVDDPMADAATCTAYTLSWYY